MAIIKVLVANDDGVAAPGIGALVRALHASPTFQVRVCAPSVEKSASSHSVATHTTIAVRVAHDGQKLGLPVSVPAASVGSTPADSVGMALNGDVFSHLGQGGGGDEVQGGLSWTPDIVVSGINRGANYGKLVYYSGTVGAAREASFSGYKALAVSLDNSRARQIDDFETATKVAVPIIEWLASESNWPTGAVLNLNIPPLDELFRLNSRYLDEKFVTKLIVSRVGASTHKGVFKLVEGELHASATANESQDGVIDLTVEPSYSKAKEDVDPAIDDMVAVMGGLTSLAPIIPAHSLDVAERAFQCLEEWTRKHRHPQIEWVGA